MEYSIQTSNVCQVIQETVNTVRNLCQIRTALEDDAADDLIHLVFYIRRWLYLKSIQSEDFQLAHHKISNLEHSIIKLELLDLHLDRVVNFTLAKQLESTKFFEFENWHFFISFIISHFIGECYN